MNNMTSMKMFIAIVLFLFCNLSQKPEIVAQNKSTTVEFNCQMSSKAKSETVTHSLLRSNMYHLPVQAMRDWFRLQSDSFQFSLNFENGPTFGCTLVLNPLFAYGPTELLKVDTMSEGLLLLKGSEDFGGVIRLAWWDGNLMGSVEQGGEVWYIESTDRQYSGNGEVMLYRQSDLNPLSQRTCGTAASEVERICQSQSLLRASAANCLQIVTVADYANYQEHQSNTTTVNNYLAGIVNMAEANFSPFTTSFSIVQQYVASSGNPWSSSTDHSLYLSNFNSWANSNLTISHDIRMIFTGLNLDGNVVGATWISSICGNSKSMIVQDNLAPSAELRVITSHELGHGYSSDHDLGNGFIMQPTVNTAATQFSSTSTSFINAFQSTYASCLACANGGPSNDDPCNAEAISACTGSVSGTISGATASGQPKGSCDGFSNPSLLDVWYSFVAPSSSCDVVVNPSSNMDAVLVIYSGSCSSLSEIACEDSGGGNNGNETANLSGLVAGNTYYIRVYDYGGALPTSFTFTVRVDGSGPQNPTISGNTTICSGQSTTLTASGCQNCQVTWSNGGSGNSISVSSPGTYTVTFDNGCGTSDASVVVTSGGVAPTTPMIGGNPSICQGQSTTLTWSNSCNGCQPQWSTGSTSNSILVSNPGTYSITVTNSCGTSNASINVTLSSGPNLQISPASPAIVAGNSIALTASGCQTYLWSPGTGLNTTSGAIVQANPSATTTYSVSCTDANGCTGTESVTVTVTNPGCIYTPGSSAANFGANGGLGGFSVIVVGTSCPVWNVSSGCAWVRINQPSGQVLGSGQVEYVVDPNLTGGTRSCTLTVAGATTPHVVTQGGQGGTGTTTADFFAGQTSGCAPLTTDFVDMSSCASGAPIQYLWNFYGGTPNTSTQANPSGITYPAQGSYAVRLVVVCNNGSSDTIVRTNYINVSCVGISEQLFFEGLTVFPNPAQDYITINGTLKYAGSASVEIVNILGQTVIHESLPISGRELNHKINLSLLNSGIFVVRLRQNGREHSQVLILE